jgi:hypothetical protein
LASFLLFLLLLGLFLFPIAIYCTVLGMINRRPQPLAVSGAWDFLGLVIATSGFLLFVGPALLSGGFRSGLRDLPLEHGSNHLAGALGEIWALWWVVWVLYYVVILVGTALLVWSRRATTVVYNIDPAVLEGALRRAAERRGLEMTRRGDRVYLSARVMSSSMVVGEGTAISASPQRESRHLETDNLTLDLESFALMNNVTIHWRSGDAPARIDLERELRKALGEVTTLENAAGGWLLSIGAFLFLLIMVVTAMLVLLTTQRR